MRASRLLSVLLLLQSRGRMSARSLASELGVSVRTILRDVDHLGEAGVPVTTERGRLGGFSLMEGWRTRLTGLTSNEARALFLAGLPGPARELGLGEALASAQLKLLATLPDGWQRDARRVGGRFHLDPVPWYRSATRSDHLSTVSDAVWNERRLFVRYGGWKGIVERTIDPLGLVLKAGEWYLVARSGGEPRTYRLSSILDLAVREGSFSRPTSFDLVTYWAESTARFEREIYRGTAVVRTTRAGLKRLRGWSAPVAAAVEVATTAPHRRGLVRVTVPIESVERAAPEILRMGPDVEVLEPVELRERVAAVAAAVATLHGRGAIRPPAPGPSLQARPSSSPAPPRRSPRASGRRGRRSRGRREA